MYQKYHVDFTARMRYAIAVTLQFELAEVAKPFLPNGLGTRLYSLQ